LRLAASSQSVGDRRVQAVVDPRPAALGGDDTRLSQHLQVMRHGRLGDVAAGAEVAGADGPVGAQLADDREPDRIGQCLEHTDVGIERTIHALIISTPLYIDNHRIIP
jgi:hypothetical protein